MEQKNKRNAARERTAGKKTSDILGGYPKILLMQLVLCAVIVIGAVVLKYVSINTFADFKESYGQIVSESYTGKLLNDNFNVFKNAVSEAFSYIDESDESKKTGTSENVPVFFLLQKSARQRAKAPLRLYCLPMYITRL